MFRVHELVVNLPCFDLSPTSHTKATPTPLTESSSSNKTKNTHKKTKHNNFKTINSVSGFLTGIGAHP